MSAPFVEDAFFFPLYNFSFAKSQVFIGIRINNRVFSLIPLVHLSVFMPIPRNGERLKFLYCTGLFSLSCVFVFPYEFEYCCFEVCEELCWDFDGDCM